jgi:aspartate-semialdehyde dehydrogenase
VSAEEPEIPIVPRLALVGASSLLGKEIKDQLAASGFPGDAVALFDLEEVAGVLTDYGEEARVFAEVVTERVLDHELVCFCGDAETAAQYLAPLLEREVLGLDCTGAWLDDERAFPWIPGCSAPPQIDTQRASAIPQAAAIMVGAASAALGDHAANASVNVFVPASERSDAGLDELSQQSTAVLNLLDTDEAVFGRRQAFDMWVPGDDSPLRRGLLDATLQRLGMAVPALNVVSVPVFHGMALSMYIDGVAADQVAAALGEAGFTVAGADAIDSPVQAVGQRGVHTLEVRDDAGGAWVWAVADNLHTRAAATVAAIHTLLGIPATDSLQ